MNAANDEEGDDDGDDDEAATTHYSYLHENYGNKESRAAFSDLGFVGSEGATRPCFAFPTAAKRAPPSSIPSSTFVSAFARSRISSLLPLH